MSKERMMILDMLESSKITSEEALVLLRALGEEDRGEVDATLEKEDPHLPEVVLQSEMNQPTESSIRAQSQIGPLLRLRYKI